MPTNEFLPFASGTDPNVMTQSAYAALSARTGGFTSGTALSEQVNKVWRQAANMSSALGGLIALRGLDALDDGDVAALRDKLLTVIPSAGDIVVYATAGSFTWIVPDGVYRIYIEVWAGGGGGGGASLGNKASGGNGGGYSAGWRTVTPGDSIAIVVGVGGSGGTSGVNGTSGGSSSVGTSSPISATGGGGGRADGVASSTIGAGSGGLLNVSGLKAANGYSISSVPVGSAGAGSFGTSATAISVSQGFTGGLPGGGGGGAANDNFGGDGGRGLVVIQY